jgi:hypothetical protein
LLGGVARQRPFANSAMTAAWEPVFYFGVPEQPSILQWGDFLPGPMHDDLPLLSAIRRETFLTT